RKLFLVAEPITESDAFTLVRWESPRVLLADGTTQDLLDTPWSHADAQWDSTTVKKDDSGKSIALTAQAAAVIEYALPADASRFLARASVDPKAKGKVRMLTVVGTDANEDKSSGLPVETDLAGLFGSGPV